MLRFLFLYVPRHGCRDRRLSPPRFCFRAALPRSGSSHHIPAALSRLLSPSGAAFEEALPENFSLMKLCALRASPLWVTQRAPPAIIIPWRVRADDACGHRRAACRRTERRGVSEASLRQAADIVPQNASSAGTAPTPLASPARGASPDRRGAAEPGGRFRHTQTDIMRRMTWFHQDRSI